MKQLTNTKYKSMNTNENKKRISGCVAEYETPGTVMVELRTEGILCFSSQLIENFSTENYTNEDFKW